MIKQQEQQKQSLTSTSPLNRVLPAVTIVCLATCAIAGLAVGVYDIAYTSVHLELPAGSEMVLNR